MIHPLLYDFICDKFRSIIWMCPFYNESVLALRKIGLLNHVLSDLILSLMKNQMEKSGSFIDKYRTVSELFIEIGWCSLRSPWMASMGVCEYCFLVLYLNILLFPLRQARKENFGHLNPTILLSACQQWWPSFRCSFFVAANSIASSSSTIRFGSSCVTADMARYGALDKRNNPPVCFKYITICWFSSRRPPKGSKCTDLFSPRGIQSLNQYDTEKI